MIRTRPALLTLAAALTLAACSGDSDAPAPDANATEAPVVENMGFENMVEPVAPSNATATPTPAADANATAEDEASADAQVQEDAEASGMTARVTREDTAPAVNETQPAAVSERK